MADSKSNYSENSKSYINNTVPNSEKAKIVNWMEDKFIYHLTLKN